MCPTHRGVGVADTSFHDRAAGPDGFLTCRGQTRPFLAGAIGTSATPFISRRSPTSRTRRGTASCCPRRPARTRPPRCALTAAVRRRSGGEVLLLAYRGRPNGHLISGQVGVNGAMIESPGCALRTDSKGSMSRTAASDQPSVFIVPFSPTSGHRTLKPAGLIHREYARVTWHIANESPWREREVAGHKPHTMRARPCLPVINGARHERGHVVLIESDEPHGHRPVVCED